MKLIKMFGLAAVAAIAAMAFIGAGTASAELCTANEEPCAAGNVLPNNSEIKSSLETGTKAILKGALEIECSVSTVNGKSTQAGNNDPVSGLIEAATWTTCSPNCTVKAEALNWTSSIKRTGDKTGTLTVSNPKVKITCLFISCTFTAVGGTVTLDVEDTEATGGKPKVIAVNEPLTSGCGAGSWTATYRVEPPNPLYFS